MTRRPDVPFSERLATARRLISAGVRRPPGHLADQLASAGSEARGLHDRIGALLPRFQPGREWSYRSDGGRHRSEHALAARPG